MKKQRLCKRCGHTWIPRKTSPLVCPRCKDPRWQTEAEDHSGMLYESEYVSIEKVTLPANFYPYNFKKKRKVYLVTNCVTNEIHFVCCERCARFSATAIEAMEFSKVADIHPPLTTKDDTLMTTDSDKDDI